MDIERIKGIIKQFGKFFAVGIINTGIDFLVLNIEMRLTGISEGKIMFVLNAVAFSVATVNSYFMNKYWTFQDQVKKEEGVKFSHFIGVSLVGTVINSSVVFLMTTYLSPFLGLVFITNLVQKFVKADPGILWANVAKLFATAVSLVWNFIGYKIWVFKK